MASVKKDVVFRYSTYNFLGLVTPIFMAGVCIPFLISNLDIRVFGYLTMMWAMVGMLSIFDFGLGRGILIMLSASKTRGILKDAELILNAVAVSVFVGTAVGFGVYGLIFALSFVGLVEFNLSQLTNVLPILLMLCAIGLTQPVFQGVMEANLEFAYLNVTRVVAGALLYFLPLIASFFDGDKIFWLTLAVFISRLFLFLSQALFIVERYPRLLSISNLSFATSKKIIRQSGWIAFSNFLSPAIGYLDRIFVGIFLGAEFLAYYSVSLEVVTKLWIIPAALVSAIAPIFSDLSIDKVHSGKRFWQALLVTAVLVSPISILLSFFSFEFLSLWISIEFATHTSEVFSLLAMAIFVSCMAQIPYVYLQCTGHSKLVALQHFFQFGCLFFALVLCFLVLDGGVYEVALLWLSRVLFDFLINFSLSIYYLRGGQ